MLPNVQEMISKEMGFQSPAECRRQLGKCHNSQ